jgi:hypothetical protein
MAAGDPGTLKRNYSATAVETTLTSALASQSQGDANTSFIVASVSGFPSSFPYSLLVDPDTNKEEVVTVYGGSGTTLQVYRGQDNTQAVAHSAGATIRHGISAREFKELQTHIAARGFVSDSGILNNVDTHVHGIVTGEGDVVGTLKTQTLTNKTLTAPKFADGGFIADANGNEIVILDTVTSAVNEVTVANAATAGKPTISATGGDTNITLNLVSKGTGTVQVNAVDVVTLSETQTLTNKTLTSPVLTLSTTTSTTDGRIAWDSGNDQLKVGDGAALRTISPDDKAATISNKTLGTDLAAGGYKITGLGDPTAGTDAVNKTYADANIAIAATSAASAATSASSALTSQTAAATSATNAATSATSAAASETAAAISTTSAAASAAAAATSATSAAASATTASNSAATATSQATAAATSATSAATSATSAATSATSAAASATAAASSEAALTDSSIQISFQVFG